MASRLFKFLVSFSVCLSTTVLAWDLPLNNCAVGTNCRATLSHIEGGGIGYNQGYTTITGFFAPSLAQTDLTPFLDLRGHLFDNGYGAFNMGVGARRGIGAKVYGLNAFYDYRATQTTHYNQISLGFESLGDRWDFRANGYLPFGSKIAATDPAYFSGFSGHQLILTQNFEFAMKGVDAEFGFPLQLPRDVALYAAVGPYFYSGEIGSNIFGGKVSLKGEFAKYFALEVSNSYDPTFHDKFQLQLTFRLPLESKSSDTRINKARMIEPVERDEIIVVGNGNKSSAAIDPLTNQPYYFVFVDNTSHSLGTFSSPYHTLAQAEANSAPNDIIYVFPGDGTTTGMSNGITLKANQKLWGSGVTQQLQTSQGNITVPALSTTAPQITNTAGDGVTLSTNNQVSGLYLNNVVGKGITGSNPESVQILSTTINNSLDDQIHLEYAGASGNVTLDNLTLTNGQNNGVYVSSTGAPFTGVIQSSTFQNNAVYAFLGSFTGKTDFNMLNNTMTGNNTSTRLAFSGLTNLLVSGNTFSNGTSISSRPLEIAAGPLALTATIENNSITNNTCGGISFELNNTSLAILSVTNNTITNNNSGSLASLGSAIFINPNGSAHNNAVLNLANNNISGNNGNGLYVYSGNIDIFAITASHNIINGNGRSGMVFSNSSTLFALNAENNTINNNGDNGISTMGGATMDNAFIVLSNNSITGNTGFGNGVVFTHTGTNFNFTALNNDISNNEGSGILSYSPTAIQNFNVLIDSNTVNNNLNLGSNATGGIDIEQFTNLTGNIANNTFSNNDSSGLFIGSTEPTPSVCIKMAGNVSSNGYVLSSGTGTFNLAPLSATSINVGTFTTIGTITAVSGCP